MSGSASLRAKDCLTCETYVGRLAAHCLTVTELTVERAANVICSHPPVLAMCTPVLDPHESVPAISLLQSDPRGHGSLLLLVSQVAPVDARATS